MTGRGDPGAKPRRKVLLGKRVDSPTLRDDQGGREVIEEGAVPARCQGLRYLQQTVMETIGKLCVPI